MKSYICIDTSNEAHSQTFESIRCNELNITIFEGANWLAPLQISNSRSSSFLQVFTAGIVLLRIILFSVAIV